MTEIDKIAEFDPAPKLFRRKIDPSDLKGAAMIRHEREQYMGLLVEFGFRPKWQLLLLRRLHAEAARREQEQQQHSPEPEERKTCMRCKQTKPVSQFRLGNGTERLATYCLECRMSNPYSKKRNETTEATAKVCASRLDASTARIAGRSQQSAVGCKDSKRSTTVLTRTTKAKNK